MLAHCPETVEIVATGAILCRQVFSNVHEPKLCIAGINALGFRRSRIYINLGAGMHILSHAGHIHPTRRTDVHRLPQQVRKRKPRITLPKIRQVRFNEVAKSQACVQLRARIRPPAGLNASRARRNRTPPPARKFQDRGADSRPFSPDQRYGQTPPR